MAEEIERVNYYEMECLGAEDFRAEQAYHRDMRRRHNAGHHRWGIVTGLELVEIAKGNGGGYDVYIYPGLAIDGFGREIIVNAPHKLDAALFRSFTGPAASYDVWIAYRELTDTPPASGYEICEGEDQNKRVHEEFLAVIQPPAPTHLPIVVDGRTPAVRTLTTAATEVSIAEDESVPYQDFPEAPNARWLVRLGSATWDAVNGRFEQTAAAKLVEGRVYTGIVASEILTPADTLTMRPRAPLDPAKVDDNPFATIKGQLQVDGRVVAKKNVYLHGGRVSLQNAGGSDDSVPLWLQRIPALAGGGADLRVHIGSTTGTNKDRQRLAIGPGSDENNPTQTTEKTILAVKADDTVDIETGKLFFGTASRQMLNLSAQTYGLGVQTSTLYQRSASEFAWYRGGVEDPNQGVPGAGGVVAMKLDAANKLTVSGPLSATWLQASDVYIDGGQLHLRQASGGIDTDDLLITRHRRAADQNDLRLIIGDNIGGDDSLSVGPMQLGSFVEQFRVRNNGDVSLKGTLTLDTGQKVNIGTMSLGGGWPVDVWVAHVFINATNSVGTRGPFVFNSRMPSFSTVTVVAALSDISNDFVATGAHWSVLAHAQKVGANQVSWDIDYRVDDVDGHLLWATVMFVLVP